jgi:hypothetical protein
MVMQTQWVAINSKVFFIAILEQILRCECCLLVLVALRLRVKEGYNLGFSLATPHMRRRG